MLVNVNQLYYDISKQPHAIIAGATGSGKSVVINGLIKTILAYNKSACFVLIDPKRVELIDYKNHPQTVIYASEQAEIIQALQKCLVVMENTYRTMQSQRIKKYNGGDIYIIIDEYADLVTVDKKTVQPIIQRLCQLGRAAKIHVILATQRPTAEIINGAIKVNIDCRLALRCPTAQDSRNLIHQNGAELLPRYGYGYYLTPDTMQPIKVSIPMI